MKAKTIAVDFCLISFYKLALDIAFEFLVFPVYGYSVLFEGHWEVNLYKVVLSYAFVWLSYSIFLLINRVQRVTRFVLVVQLLLIVVPFLTLYGFENIPTSTVGIVILGFGCVVLFSQMIPALKVPTISTGIRWVVVFIAISLVFYVCLGLLSTGGLARFNLNLRDVYAVRAEYSRHVLFGFGYLLPWVAYVINISMLVFFVSNYKSNRIISFFGVASVFVLQIILFGMTNFKAFLFLPFVVIAAVFTLKRVDLLRATLIGSIMSIGLLVCFFVSGIRFSVAILNRVFFTQPALHELYMNYFSNHAFGLLVDSVGGLFGSSYHEHLVKVIADFYWSYPTSPNVGWIANAYSNFGVGGVIFYSAILALVLRIGDSLVRPSAPRGAVEGVFFAAAMGLNNSALTTTMLTHGLLISMAALWVLGSYWNDWWCKANSKAALRNVIVD